MFIHLQRGKMDMIKNIPVHMDYVGQGRAEKLYQVIAALQIILEKHDFCHQ